MCNHSLSKIALVFISICFAQSTVFAQVLPDPTRPAGTKAYSASANAKRVKTWSLSSTLIANGRRNAVINGQLVIVGQSINNAKIISIQPNEVWLLHKQKRIRIKLLAKEIKDFSPAAAK